MADEAKPQAEGEATPEGEVKPSFVQKFKPVLIGVGAALIGAGIASAGFMIGGGQKAAPPAAAEQAHGAAAPEAGHGAAPVEAPVEHTGAAIKDEALEHKTENLADLGEIEADDIEGGHEKPVADINPAQIIKFDGLVVNIFEKNSIHYLKITMEIAVNNMAAVEEYNIIKPKLRDRALFVISDTTLREILNPGGKALLKEDLITAFNRIFKKGQVAQIFFTDFTVQ